MAKKSVFLDAIKTQIGIGIYVWGANGELLKDINEAWIREKEKDPDYEKWALEMYRERKGIAGARAVDCSGLVVFGLRFSGAKGSSFDTTAEGLRTKYCTEIDKKELCNGDLCFKMSGGKAVHVGVYLDGKVVESQGRKQGVVYRSMILGGWSKYGRLNIKWEDEPKGFVLTRLLKKGCKGADVKALQELLHKLGYTSVGKADSIFGSNTKSAVQELQRNSFIKADGIVGRDTCKILGWTWKG